MSDPNYRPTEGLVELLATARPFTDPAEVFAGMAEPPADASSIDVTGLDPASILAALYNASQPLGRGILNSLSERPMSVGEARDYLDGLPTEDYSSQGPSKYVDYCRGRVIKTYFGLERLDPRLFDRDNGTGAAARAIAGLRHQEGTRP